MGMCVSERVELDALRERVAELERKLAALAMALEAVELRREPLHLKGSQRGR